MITRRGLLVATAVLLVFAGAARAHTMFLKLESFFLEPNAAAEVELMNGDFNLSENPITRDRMVDVSIVGPDGRSHPPESAWRDEARYEGNENDIDTSVLTFTTGASGTYLLGVSTAARTFDLTAAEFNDYLAHDGIADVIAAREASGRAGEAATERYSKHVKAVLQVGDRRSEHFGHALGYPVELLPLTNPYDLGAGDELRVRLVREGAPLANHLVYASSEEHHGHAADGGHTEAVETRTNGEGVATIPLSVGGRWYIRAIHMSEPTTESGVDYVSNWATLTFEVR